MNSSNSGGPDFIEFNEDVLCSPLDPWQRFISYHGLEMLPDGRPRFRTVLVIVGRQNGKTEIPVRLSLYWQWVEEVPLVLGTSTKIDYAKESWMKAVRLAEKAPGIPVTKHDRKKWTRQANGEQESWNTTEDGDDCRYKIAASNEEGGRSLTVHRLILDELRQHKTYAAWGASVPAVNAVRNGQVWALSNQGDATSVVLNDKRGAALDFITEIEKGADPRSAGDYRFGLFEYSAPEDSDPEDPYALACANPNMGADHDHALDPEVLMGDAHTAVLAGDEALTTFKIEVMCISVPKIEAAIDATAWIGLQSEGDLSGYRSRIAACIDLSPDQMHATLVAAARISATQSRVEVVRAWSGAGCVARMRSELPGLILKMRPKTLGWMPGGPAAAVAADMRTKARNWPPPGTKLEEITGESSAICMGFAEQVTSAAVVYALDDLLTAHVTQAEKQKRGGTWVFARSDGGHVDAAYAAAGALHLARQLPLTQGRGGVITSVPTPRKD